MEKTTKNKKLKNQWLWIGVGVLVLLTILGNFYSPDVSDSYVKDRATTLQSEQKSIHGFTKYSGKEAGFNFSVLFPTSNPKRFSLDLGDMYNTSYQSQDIINLEERKFVQYSCNFAVLQEGKILSEESIKAYLESYPKGKSGSFEGTLIKEEMITYKGLSAIEYIFNSEMYGTSMTHKGISFIVDGLPIDLSVVYTNLTPIANIHYDGYIKSFAILEK